MTMQKRILDVLVSFAGLVLLSPLLLFTGLAIRLEDRGPAIFRQKRLGRDGRVFNVYKFRKFSNHLNASGPLFTFTDDERYSKVGRLLEKTKLNELPQLVNILRGEMSLVGPRPEIVELRHCFNGSHAALLEHAPGLFGPSQSAFRNEAAMYPPGEDAAEYYERVLFPQKAKLDLDYYRQATFTSDIYWVFRSLVVVIRDVHTSETHVSSQAR